ncbi:DUF4232 domain-containing protein [Streptomyces sp. SP18CS02]|uniref:DUF4232 domain-containing protein n=1 Tax=Streptomyces sp. SP18CS02 TaxID=3002531 RepID=UPI002E790936|nr:DUF4232 domain-containing protein [Streptomyces sp. SP18CS02]MEE1753965.1 DUF4232 domain-containing protein [Streptomyces sp. SP18CS02]
MSRVPTCTLRRAAGLLAALAAAASALATAPAATAAPAPCRSAVMALSWGTGGTAVPGGSAPGTQRTADVSVTNKGSDACALRGYPDVKLVQGETVETLFDQTSASPGTVTVEPGASARFTLTFLAAKAGEAAVIEPTHAAVVLPNTTAGKHLQWQWGPVAQQEAATHPGNYTGPVRG